MSLFWAEHQKLWRAGLTRLATGLFLALLTALQLWSYQSANYGTMKADGSRYLDGPANIRERQAYARQWEVLTDETLQQMVSALQTARAANPEMDSERVNLYVLNDLLGSYWPELTDETQPYPSMLCWYANPASLTGLYDRRDAALRTFLENQFAAPADQAFFTGRMPKSNGRCGTVGRKAGPTCWATASADSGSCFCRRCWGLCSRRCSRGKIAAGCARCS